MQQQSQRRLTSYNRFDIDAISTSIYSANAMRFHPPPPPPPPPTPVPRKFDRQTISPKVVGAMPLARKMSSSAASSSPGRKIFKCKYGDCPKQYGTSEGLRLHHRNIHEHDKRNVCRFCPKRFVRVSDMKLHILRMHEDNRPFPCTFESCDKSFACNSELIRHMAIHTTGKSRGPYNKRRKIDEDED